MLYRGEMMVDAVAAPTANMEKSVSLQSTSNAWTVSSDATYSTTNIQVWWVDEADTVKTDGKNLYQYRQNANTVEVVDAKNLTNISTIKLTTNFSNINLYVSGSQLIIVWQKYYSSPYNSWNYRWYAPDQKVFVAVYNISNPASPVLAHSHEVDGYLQDSRLNGNQLYFITQSDFRVAPYYITEFAKSSNRLQDTTNALSKNFSLTNMVPEVRDTLSNPLARLGFSKYIQSIRRVADNCQNIAFVLPEGKTLSSLNISPTFTTIASLDISQSRPKVKTSLVFGSVSQIHMSQSSLYLVSSISQTSSPVDVSCPAGTLCQPYRPELGYISSTLVHRFSLSAGNAIYQNTTTVGGNPLNQYSMDEDASGNFRIVTSIHDWSNGENNNSTSVSVINKSGKVIGSLGGIGKWENFQSARFIGKRLYLVTFEQIDPLFVIDMSVATAPKILGELIMPGYSTYLHPYDDNRLIGLGYDTYTNKWGGTQNGGLKVDLYNVADVKNPKKEGSLVLGDAGSSSEVLQNPRAFVYYKEKNLLLLPATLMTSAKDPENTYRSSKAFQWVIGISIVPNSITEKFRLSHMPSSSTLTDAWKKECAEYSGSNGGKCVTLLDGSSYCPSSSRYVPSYCYATSTVDEYFANQLWNYSSDFVNRVLYIGDTTYTLAENGIKAWSLLSPVSPKGSLQYKVNKNTSSSNKPVPMIAPETVMIR
jgi:inhibitor of cysteine peptidase